jgi:hypothetical protein
VEDELPSGCGGVDCLGDRLEADLAGVEAGDRFDEVLEGAAKPVQAPDDQGVTGPDVAEGFIKAFALGFGS